MTRRGLPRFRDVASRLLVGYCAGIGGLRGYRRDCDQRGCEVAVILIIKMLNDALPPKVQVSHRLRNDRHQNATIFAGLQGRLDC